MQNSPMNQPREWRYSINYGPDGEANYAFVYDADGALVSNLKTHHAVAVVDAMNRTASGLSIVPAVSDEGVRDVIARLRDKHAVKWDDCLEAASTIEALASREAALQARAEELEKGLEPFVKAAADIGAWVKSDDGPLFDDDTRVSGLHRLTFGDFRRAASLLSIAGGKDAAA